MNRQQTEAKVLSFYDATQDGNRVEDSLVELKRDWPSDHAKAARRIAAHANAARGEDILWIIGLDEASGVKPLSSVDLADWWPQVATHFDGLTPPIQDFVVYTNDGPVVALHFDTDSAPYVVKNPMHGHRGGGPVEREVPWRVGTRVRSATREDLIRLLVPVQKLPDVELLDARVQVVPKKTRDDSYGEEVRDIERTPHLIWDIHLTLYVTPQDAELVVFPVHRTALSLRIGREAASVIKVSKLHFGIPGFLTGQGWQSTSKTTTVTNSEAIIPAPGKLLVNGSYIESPHIYDKSDTVITLVIKPARSDRAVTISQKLTFRESEGKHQWSWKSDD